MTRRPTQPEGSKEPTLVTEERRRRGIDALLLVRFATAAESSDHRNIELSWVLEDNYPVKRTTAEFGSRGTKVHRIWQRCDPW